MLFHLPSKEWKMLEVKEQIEIFRLVAAKFFVKEYWCSKAHILTEGDGVEIYFIGKCLERKT